MSIKVDAPVGSMYVFFMALGFHEDSQLGFVSDSGLGLYRLVVGMWY